MTILGGWRTVQDFTHKIGDSDGDGRGSFGVIKTRRMKSPRSWAPWPIKSPDKERRLKADVKDKRRELGGFEELKLMLGGKKYKAGIVLGEDPCGRRYRAKNWRLFTGLRASTDRLLDNLCVKPEYLTANPALVSGSRLKVGPLSTEARCWGGGPTRFALSSNYKDMVTKPDVDVLGLAPAELEVAVNVENIGNPDRLSLGLSLSFEWQLTVDGGSGAGVEDQTSKKKISAGWLERSPSKSSQNLPAYWARGILRNARCTLQDGR
ncbi:hypothetical protein BDZ89DRAFT_1039615 [Hymenopellis radicata]|nr:hypothetical protein BDZ89DRAFT_1039615 [Hymenopellis radicata]